jgi:hypothetical protein
VSLRAAAIVALLCRTAVGLAAPSAWDRPVSAATSRRALRGVIRDAKAAVRRGEHPIVVVDIDDTAADGRARLRMAATRAGLPNEGLKSAADLYVGVARGDRDQKRAAFNAAYFDDPKLAALDKAQRGAPSFLRAVAKTGARVMYVSGRWESTRAATEAYLRGLDLPLASSADLLLNPSSSVRAAVWKRKARAVIGKAGKPLAFFDNEAEAIDGYKKKFPEAHGFRLATFRFGGAPATKPRGVLVIDDFSRGRGR